MIVDIDKILNRNTKQTTIVPLPVGSVVWDIRLLVGTQFNGSGTDQLDIGIGGDDDYYESNFDLSSGTGFQTLSLTNVPDLMNGTTNITFDYDDQNADASAGEALIWIHYSIH